MKSIGQVQQEIDRVYRLYQEQQLDTSSFGRFFQPLEERRKQLEVDIPRLQAEIDITTVQALSAEEVASEAQNLTKLWPKMEPDDRRRIVEAITEKVIIGKSEIDISFCYSPSYTDLSKRWRKGEDSNLR